MDLLIGCFLQAKAGQAYDSAAQGAHQAKDYTQVCRTVQARAFCSPSALHTPETCSSWSEASDKLVFLSNHRSRWSPRALPRRARLVRRLEEGRTTSPASSRTPTHVSQGTPLGGTHVSQGTTLGGTHAVKDYNAQVLDALKAGAQPTTVGATTQQVCQARS